jgi:isoquinoline 1-oxidoreductase alpha subunit
MAVLNVNGKAVEYTADPETPLLWVLREQLGLTGTKYGCGIAQCGSCTVHIDGAPVRACSMPVKAVGTQKVLTIEGARGEAARCTRCSSPGSPATCRSAATARAAW